MIDAVKLDDTIEQGSQWGPLFQTSVVGFSSGANQRNEDWSQCKLVGDISYGIDGPELFRAVKAFFEARRGASRGFLFKDWASGPAVDELIGTGDGTTTIFLLTRTSASDTTPPTDYVRRITRPDSATLVVKVDGVISSDYTLGIGGWIQFNTAPGNGLDITASFEYTHTVRFVDDGLSVIMTWEQAGQIGAIKIEEIRDTETDIDSVCSVTLTNKVTSLPEDTSTAADVLVANVVVVDPFPTSDVYLSGTDASYFRLSGGNLYLKAGTVLSIATKASYDVTVNLRDPNIPGIDPIDSDSLTVTLSTNSNAGVSIAITVLVPNYPNGTSSASALHVADVVVTGGHSGSNTLALSGADAASFHLTGTQLFLNAGTDGGTLTAPPGAYDVTVTVTDTTNANTDNATYTLTVGTGVTPSVTDYIVDTPAAPVPNYNFLQIEMWGDGAGGAGTSFKGADGSDSAILSLGLTAGGGKAPLTTQSIGGAVIFNTTGGAGGLATGGDVNTNGKPGANGSYNRYATVAAAFDQSAGDGAAGPLAALTGSNSGIATVPIFVSSTDGTASGYPVYADATDGADLGEGGGGSCSALIVLAGLTLGYVIDVLARPGGGGGAYVKKTYAAGSNGAPAFGSTLAIFVGQGGAGGVSFADGGDGYRGLVRVTVT